MTSAKDSGDLPKLTRSLLPTFGISTPFFPCDSFILADRGCGRAKHRAGSWVTHSMLQPVLAAPTVTPPQSPPPSLSCSLLVLGSQMGT